MTIAKGCTESLAQRDIITQGFNDLLGVLNRYKNHNEIRIKAELYDIINEKSLSDEERVSQVSQFNGLLTELEEIAIRIRRTIFIGLYSFWELSLKNICEYYYMNCDRKKSARGYSENDYLNAILHSDRPDKISLISIEIKELRNYMTHGSLDTKRKSIIDGLISAHPEFDIGKSGEEYYLTSYDGLKQILNIINEGAHYVEETAKTINKKP